MIWFIYNVLFTIGYVLLLPRFLLRMWRRGGYGKGFLQRLAVYGPDVLGQLRIGPRIWVHAVSVGEIYVALRFMEQLRASAPNTRFVLTTTTSTGRAVAGQKLCPEDVLLYFPADFPCIVRRVLNVMRPRAVVLTESELWPNLIRIAESKNIPVVLINGRISESSFRGYKLLRVFSKRALGSVALFLVQAPQDQRRLVKLGAAEEKIHVVGTAKYDVVESDGEGAQKARQILDASGFSPGSLIMLGGSTWAGEEAVLLDVYERLRGSFGRLKVVLVPRHAERRGEVEAEIARRGLSYLRRSEVTEGPGRVEGSESGVDVLLVDTTGELRNFYAHASVIFVGKSLASRGGQNVIEPASLGKPIVVGPHMENFPVVVSDFLSAKALIQVADTNALERAFRNLLADADLREQYGQRAQAVVRSKRGALARSVELAEKVIS